VSVPEHAGSSASFVYTFVVLFDPTEGYVSGSGSINSAAGSYVPDPAVKGPATFGFQVKYNKNALVPSGTNTFKIKAPNFLFESTAFDWLVISGASAQFKGSGTVNSTGSYGFLVTITDGEQTGGDGIDRYRLKLTDNSTGQVVYDNVMGAPDDMATANPQPISSGNVLVFIDTPPTITTLSLLQPTINEGDQLWLSGAFSDPDAGQSHTVIIDWGDGTTRTLSFSGAFWDFATGHTYKDNPSSTPTYTIKVTVTDPLGATGTGSTPVTVNNLPPVVTNVTGPTAVVATGAATSVTAYFTDPGVLDTHTCLFAFGDGQTRSPLVTETNGSGSCKASYTYPSGGTYTATVTVTDKDGGSVTSTFQLTVNTPPAITSLALSSTAINESGQPTLTGKFTDPDASDTHTITINWADGTANTSVSLVAGTLNFSATHLYKNNPAGSPSGPYNIGVTVADNHSGKDNTGSTAVTVSNVAPVIGTMSKPAPAVILGSAGNAKVNFTDVGTLDTHTCTFAWGDGQTASGSVTETNGSGSCAASYTYSSAGTYPVTATITDKDGGSVSSSFQIVVDTAPSALSLGLSAATINENDQTTLTGTFTDQDPADTHKITINWGDGTSITSISLLAGVFKFSATHRYLDNPAGVPPTINVTVADNWNGSAAGSTSVTVNNVAPVITGQTSTVQTLPVWFNFKDPGTLDTHTCTIAWGDGQTISFPAYESAGSGACTIGHTYTTPGTYTLAITVTDKDSGSATANFSVASN